MMLIGEIRVEEDVVPAQFSCDLTRCRGACCTLAGGRGAPLLDEEASFLTRYFQMIRRHLSPRSEAHIRENGMTEGFAGNHATTCIDDRDCVFVVYEGKIATCAIEKSFLAGEIPWRKPVSCHLFPLRYSGGPDGVLRFEQIDECNPGRALGLSLKKFLREFTGEALVRRFGGAWYQKFLAACENRGRLTGTHEYT